jgi:hypothetical protein
VQLQDRRYVDVLRTIHARLNGADLIWAITGSMSFALQGVPVQPHDVDLQTNQAGAYGIERLFAERMVRQVAFSEAPRIRSHFGALQIDGVTVEIMGDVQKRLEDGSWEPPVDIRPYIRMVDVEGLRLPVLSLEYEYRAYLALGRVERAEMLRRWFQARSRD